MQEHIKQTSPLWVYIRIWPEKTGTAEMHNMGGSFGDPNFRFPLDLLQTTRKRITSFKHRHENKSVPKSREQFYEHPAMLPVSNTITRNGLTNEQPLTFRVVDNHVRHFGFHVNFDAEKFEMFRIEMPKLVIDILYIHHHSTGNIPRAEVLDKRLNK